MNEKQKSLIISSHRHRIGFEFQLSTGSSTAFFESRYDYCKVLIRFFED